MTDEDFRNRLKPSDRLPNEQPLDKSTSLVRFWKEEAERLQAELDFLKRDALRLDKFQRDKLRELVRSMPALLRDRDAVEEWSDGQPAKTKR
jgi:hypothetical protein